MEQLPKYTLGKNKKLKNAQDISMLFRQGQRVSAFPLTCIFQPIEKENPSAKVCQVAFSIPKKKVKLAVKRNLLKRRLRESYRQEQYRFPKGLKLLFIYQTTDILSHAEILEAMQKLATKVSQKLDGVS